jgi:hypothetical protein
MTLSSEVVRYPFNEDCDEGLPCIIHCNKVGQGHPIEWIVLLALKTSKAADMWKIGRGYQQMMNTPTINYCVKHWTTLTEDEKQWEWFVVHPTTMSISGDRSPNVLMSG